MKKGPEHTPFLAQIAKRYAPKDDPTELFEAARAVESLLEHPGWRVVTELLDAGRESVEASMKYGQVLEQGEYARRLGQMVGLESLKAAPEAVLLKAESVQAELEREPVEA